MEEKDQDMNIAVLNTEIKNISEKIHTMNTDIGKQLNSIEAKVTKTNGRVQNLELWRAMLIGGMTVLTMLVVPIVLSLAKDWLSR